MITDSIMAYKVLKIIDKQKVTFEEALDIIDKENQEVIGDSLIVNKRGSLTWTDK